MHTPVKMHRSTAVIAALLMILSDGMNVVTVFLDKSEGSLFAAVVLSVFSLLFPIWFVVILLRGKKDIFAGVVFIAAVALSLFTVMFDALSIFAGYVVGSDALSKHFALGDIVIGLVGAVFMVLLGVECLSKGKISVGRLRAVLWILPVVILGCKIWQMVPLYLQDGMTVWETVLAFLTGNFPKRLAHILMGVAMSIPQKAET